MSIRSTRRLTATLTAAVVLLLAPVPSASSLTKVKVGDIPPSFSLRDLAGQPFDSTSLSGSPAAVIFWSTWSPRSADVLADFKEFHAEFGDKGFRVAAVDIDGENLPDDRQREVREYAARLELPFPVLLDAGLETFSAWGVMAHPSLVLLDAAGKVSYVLGGYPRSARDEVRENILKLLGLWVEPEKPTSTLESYRPKGGALQYHNMGKQLLERGQTDKALDYFGRAAERDPAWMEPVIMAARAHLLLGDLPAGEALLAKLDPEAINRSDVRFLMAWLLLLKDKPAGAEALFRAVSDKSPGEGLGQWGLGMAALARGEGPASLEWFSQARQAAPAPPEAEFFAHRWFGHLWSKGESLPDEDRFLEVFPGLADVRQRYRHLAETPPEKAP